MATVEDVARSVLAAIDTTAGQLLACQWVADRFQRIASRGRLRSLRRIGEVVVPAVVSAGSLTVTLGSRVVTGDATAQAAWQAFAGQPFGRYLRQSVVWYEISQVTPDGNLELAVPYTEPTLTGGGYYIAARRIRLAPDARWLAQGGMVHMRTWTPMLNVSLGELDYQSPSRPIIGGWPALWAEVQGAASDGVKVVEMYPYPQQDEMVAYVYWVKPPVLGFSDEVPPAVDPYVLKEGALIDAMRYNASKAANAGKVEEAAYWRNEYRAQATSWESQVLDAIRADRGVDDVSFVLQLRNTRSGTFRDITNAREQAWSQWPALP